MTPLDRLFENVERHKALTVGLTEIQEEFHLPYLIVRNHCEWVTRKYENWISIPGYTKKWKRTVACPAIEFEISGEQVKMILNLVITETHYRGLMHSSCYHWVDWPASLARFRIWLKNACEAAAA